jgi:hypothetical protein
MTADGDAHNEVTFDSPEAFQAALMPVAGNRDLFGPDACDRTLAIFDGRYRYDLVLNYERAEPLSDVLGFPTPVAVCRSASAVRLRRSSADAAAADTAAP